MKHLANRRSGRLLCKVKNPRVTKNTTDVGKLLGTNEQWCRECALHLNEYYDRMTIPVPKWQLALLGGLGADKLNTLEEQFK